MMQNIEKEFNGILKQYGHNVLVLRKNTKTRCICYDPLLQASDRDCPYCFGMGVVPIAEKHLIRDMDMKVPDTLPYIASQQLYGKLAVSSRSYFFKKDAKIAIEDLIIDVDWIGNQPVYKDGGIYEISHIDPQRFLNGEVVFQKVYVKDQPVEKAIRAIRIMESFGDRFFQIAEGEG